MRAIVMRGGQIGVVGDSPQENDPTQPPRSNPAPSPNVLTENVGSGDQDEGIDLPDGQEPEYPLVELACLDEMINRTHWVVPVFPKGELEILLAASIRLCRQGLDTRSEACQRFFRDGLTISFTKLLADEAVIGWKYGIQRCIMKNCEHLIELCVLKLNQDCLPLLDLLSMVLNPGSKFHTFNATRPSETVPSNSQLQDETDGVYARPSDLRSPNGWLVDLINRFGSWEGFNLLLERFQNGNALTVPVIAALIRPFGMCHEYLTLQTTEKYFMPIVEIVPSFLDNLTDDELKKEAKNLSEIVKALKCLAAKVPNQEVKTLETFRLKMILRERAPSQRNMANEKIQVFDWKIVNFSCWCEAVHGKSIESATFFFAPFKRAELYPKGFSGQDSHTVLKICDVARDFTGELSVIGSDGSSIHSQTVKLTKKDDKVLEVLLGAKFEEVVARIGKADLEDEITLRFCIQSDSDYEQRMCTTVDVLKTSLKIDRILIKSAKTGTKGLFFIPSTSKRDAEGMLLKIACKSDKIQFIMEPDKNIKVVLVESCTYMLSSDGALIECDENKHVCVDKKQWTFSESLKIKELEENDATILLRFKITSGLIIQSYNHLNYYSKEISIVPYDRSIRFSDLKSSESPASSNRSDDSVTVLTNELMCLYQDQDFSDFQLKCGDITFPVHRAILSARSPVLKTMLSCDMKEAASGCMDITDLDPSTLSLFLTYLYTGVVEDLQSDRAIKLYYAADKYQVPTLKGECGDFLRVNISIENVCDVLTLADKHKDDALTAVSQDFILNHFNQLLGSEEWENFMEREPVLALKTVTHFGKKHYLGKIQKP